MLFDAADALQTSNNNIIDGSSYRFNDSNLLDDKDLDAFQDEN